MEEDIQPIEIANDQVHVWSAMLNQPPAYLQRFLNTLSSDERDRANRFHFDRDRQHFIAARGILRTILSYYLPHKPEQLCFRYTKYGKPYLEIADISCDLRFNLSHSHGMAVFAFTKGQEIGVDIEWIRKGISREQIAERYFSHHEVSALHRLSEDQQDEAFFNCWTRKEAFIKAKGEGLSMPLDEFTVSLAPGEPASLLSLKNYPQELSRWTLRELSPPAGFAAAVAVEVLAPKLELWKWPDSLSTPARLPRLSPLGRSS